MQAELIVLRHGADERQRADAARAQAEQSQAEAHEHAWSGVRDRYRCTGGMVTGLVIRDGYANVEMGGLEALQGSQSYPAEVRGGRIYITDRQRGTVAWRIEGGGTALVPPSPFYARRCTKR
ncbi:MAG: hypothetical protein IPK60_10370 [Sandaracinaceae bacterium]|nr:hypothetical protein [Sandaracinaceae bacterium]